MPLASSELRDLLLRNRRSESLGTYAVCSAHPHVLDAAMRQAIEDRSLLHIESTSSQVNQLGGYTGQTPADFARFVLAKAQNAGLPAGRILLGGDHLGPYPWRKQPSIQAMQHAHDLVRACVLAGYEKIHLDASMSCADDPQPALDEPTIADRAAALCRTAEQSHKELSSKSAGLLYVIGTEVPIPGGETGPGEPPAVTPPERVAHTLETFRAAFQRHNVEAAWERVIGLVVQPGVEFGDDVVFNYDRAKARALVVALPRHPELVYEAHSTDYQPRAALSQLVEDHFAILKVGPWLTFAFREAVFALEAIERELLGNRRNIQLSQTRKALEVAMHSNPSYWKPYYHGDEDQQRFARAFSYSDRCRYYWPDDAVQRELARLLANLNGTPLPLPLVSQYLPREHDAIRNGELDLASEALIEHHIRLILREYATACGVARAR